MKSVKEVMEYANRIHWDFRTEFKRLPDKTRKIEAARELRRSYDYEGNPITCESCQFYGYSEEECTNCINLSQYRRDLTY